MFKEVFEGDIIRGLHEINIEFLNLGQPLTQMGPDGPKQTQMDQDGPGWTQTDPGVEFKPEKAGIL